MHARVPEEEGSGLDVALWFLAGFMALGILLVAPKVGQIATVVVLIGMAVCLIHPLWKIPYVRKAPSTKQRRIRFAESLIVSSIVLIMFGIYVWPPARRHHLDEREWQAFQKPLRSQAEQREKIQILCPASDEGSCIYAQQFVNVFRDAGWTVEGNAIERVTISAPTAGVTIYSRGDGQLDPNNWRSGLWVTWTPSFINLCQAFENIGIEPESQATLQQRHDELAIYFGLEKENQSEETDVTKWMRKYRGNGTLDPRKDSN
jgi:hypothetical protein